MDSSFNKTNRSLLAIFIKMDFWFSLVSYHSTFAGTSAVASFGDRT